jgi:uncharacterized protein (TIGR02452 family)
VLLERDPRAEPGLGRALQARAGQVLAIAQAHGHRCLLLGAWGCGVFRNDPRQVAEAFGAWLEAERFRGAFDRVVFAVYTPRSRDEANLPAFEARFGPQS